ncbi:DUF1844 domain-containing protein [Silvibacterium sp.]|uniref:DUF1844 domain-containing protein n=1 Tax=Silvibacterium sp. TaxID=1964179 RepID=UPI0039E449F4
MAEKPPAFVVTDRRKFTEDGDLRNPAEATAEPAAEFSANAAEAVHPAPGQLTSHLAEAVHPAPGQFTAAAEPAPPAPASAGARVVTMPSPARPVAAAPAPPSPAPIVVPAPVAEEAAIPADEHGLDVPGSEISGLEEPSDAEHAEQHAAYQETTQQLDELLRQQNPGMKDTGPIGIEHVFQSIYLSAVVAMGAATEPGQKPRIDILGARQSIDMLIALEEKTKGNLSEQQTRLLQSLIFELRMMFLEITNAIAQQAHMPPGRI